MSPPPPPPDPAPVPPPPFPPLSKPRVPAAFLQGSDKTVLGVWPALLASVARPDTTVLADWAWKTKLLTYVTFLVRVKFKRRRTILWPRNWERLQVGLWTDMSAIIICTWHPMTQRKLRWSSTHTHIHTLTHSLTHRGVLLFLAQLPTLFQHKFKWRMKVPNIIESKTRKSQSIPGEFTSRQ